MALSLFLLKYAEGVVDAKLPQNGWFNIKLVHLHELTCDKLVFNDFI